MRRLWTLRVIDALPAWWKGALLILIGAIIHPLVAYISIFIAGYYVGSKYPDRRDRAALKSLQTGATGCALYMLLIIGLLGPEFIEFVQYRPEYLPAMVFSFAQIIMIVLLVGIWSSKRASVLKRGDL